MWVTLFRSRRAFAGPLPPSDVLNIHHRVINTVQFAEWILLEISADRSLIIIKFHSSIRNV